MENADANRMCVLPQCTLLSPPLVRSHRSLVHENAKLLVGSRSQARDWGSASTAPEAMLASLRSSRRFQELVSTMAQQKKWAKDRRKQVAKAVPPDSTRLAGFVRHAFAALRLHAEAQQREVNALIRSLAAWRRQQLSLHLALWHSAVIECAFDLLATAFDQWLRYCKTKARSRVLEDGLAALSRTLRLWTLEHYFHWWSLVSDLSRDVRLRSLAAALHAFQSGAHVCAWMRAAKRRAMCFSTALTLTRTFHLWHACAQHFRSAPPPTTSLPFSLISLRLIGG
jgi:hypothetical protein